MQPTIIANVKLVVTQLYPTPDPALSIPFKIFVPLHCSPLCQTHLNTEEYFFKWIIIAGVSMISYRHNDATPKT